MFWTWDNLAFNSFMLTVLAMALTFVYFWNISRYKKSKYITATTTSKLENSKSVNQEDSSPSSILQKKKSSGLKCPICQKRSKNTCSDCKKVAYCCVEHQKLDWKNHKKVCQAFSIEPVEGMGLGWVAKRDIKAGFLLLEEAPAILFPSWLRLVNADGLGRCVTCGTRMEEITKSCSTCSWPVCSAQCEMNPLHMENECAEFVSRKLVYENVPKLWPCGMLIACVRANVMKAQNPEKFKQLMALQDFRDIPSSNKELLELDLPAGMFDALKMNGASCLDLEEYRKLLRILRVNGFEHGETTLISKRMTGTSCSIYLKSSRLNHSCVGNCFAKVVDSVNGTMRVFTTVPINKGEQITTNYFESFSFFPTADRQKIQKSRGFICRCKRCLDPTEMNTFFSGIKCFKCSNQIKADSDKVGFFVPANPLDFDTPDPYLRCHRCHVELPRSKVEARLPTTIVHAFSDSRSKKMDGTFKEYLEKFMELYEGGREFKDHLHPNHWLIVETLMCVNEMRRMDVPTMDKLQLKRRLEQLELIMEVEDKLFPGVRPSKLYCMQMWEDTGTYLAEKFYADLTSKERLKLMRIHCKIQRDKIAVEMMENRGRKEMNAFAETLKGGDQMEKDFERAILSKLR